jgi:tetratricopeptide (TPR) repeat protein
VQLQEQADALERAKNLKGAAALFERIVELRRAALGNKDKTVGAALYRLGRLRKEMGEYDQAIARMQEALGILEKAFPDQHTSSGITRYELAELYKLTGKRKEAIRWYRLALEKLEKGLKGNDPNLAATYNVLAEEEKDDLQYSNAWKSLQKALAIYQMPPNRVPAATLGLAFDLAAAARKAGQFALTVTIYRACVPVLETSPTLKAAHLADILSGVAGVYHAEGRYYDAKREYLKVIDVRQTTGAPPELLAGSLARLGDLERENGFFEAAQTRYEKSIALLRPVDPDSLQIARVGTELAFVYLRLGNLPAGRAMAEEVLAKYTAEFGSAAPQTTEPLFYLATTLSQQFDFAPAKVAALRLLKILDTEKDRNHERLAACYQILALIARGLTEKRDADAYEDKALQELVVVDGSSGEVLEQRARIAVRQRDPKAAKGYLEKAKALLEKDQPVSALSYATLLESLASVEADLEPKGSFSARRYHQDSIAIRRQLYGPASMNLAAALFNSARYERDRDPARAETQFLEAISIAGKYSRTVLPMLSFAEQAVYDRMQTVIYVAGTMDLCKTRDGRDAAYREFFRWKGGLVESLRRQAQLSVLAVKPAVRNLVEQLQEASYNLASHYTQFSKYKPADWLARQAQLTDAKEALEHQLVKELADDRTTPTFLLDFTFDQFTGALAADEVFIDLYKYKPFGSEAYTYVAFIVSPDKKIGFVDLGDASPIEKELKSWYRRLNDPEESDTSWTKVQELVWNKLADALPAQARKVWIAPDGTLARMPWQLFAPSLDRTRAVLVSQLNAPRELLRLRSPGGRASGDGTTMLVVGDVWKNGRPILDKSGDEIKAIQTVVSRAGVSAGNPLVREQATRRNVMERSPGADYIHISTHGFFWSSPPGAEESEKKKNDKPIEPTRSPLVTSGFELSGDRRQAAGTHDNQGLLTAEEIIGLDCRRCKLMVLSACDSGVGVAIDGQGMMGLRTSVSAAGVKCMLVSTGPVPIEGTVRLMTAFYNNLLQKKLAPAEALKSAQDEVRAIPELARPDYWVSWVLVGQAW